MGLYMFKTVVFNDVLAEVKQSFHKKETFSDHLGGILGHLGGVLGHLGALLGPSWGNLGPSRGHLGILWAMLGPA